MGTQKARPWLCVMSQEALIAAELDSYGDICSNMRQSTMEGLLK